MGVILQRMAGPLPTVRFVASTIVLSAGFILMLFFAGGPLWTLFVSIGWALVAVSTWIGMDTVVARQPARAWHVIMAVALVTTTLLFLLANQHLGDLQPKAATGPEWMTHPALLIPLWVAAMTVNVLRWRRG